MNPHEEQCGNCKFWKYLHIEKDTKIKKGICRRYPPTKSIASSKGLYITVITGHDVILEATDWCGEYKRKK